MKKLLGLVTILTICVATFATWRVLGSPMLGVDDAEIFFVYARNLVQGHGIVYTVGAGHVEGYSSVLYFLLCAAAFAVSHAPETLLLFVDLLFAVLTSLCVLRVLNDLVDRLSLGEPVRILFAAAYLLWMGTNPLYFTWSVVSLMDTGVYSLVVTAAFALLARLILTEREVTRSDSLALAALIVLAILSRPEGPFWAILSLAAFAVLCLQRAAYASPGTPRWLPAAKQVATPLIAMAATPLAIIVFRLRYFGYPLPNTYYAKVSSSFFYTYSAGHHYFISFKDFYGPFVWLALVLTACLLIYTVVLKRRLTPLSAFATLTTLYGFAALAGPVFEGGDHFNGFRMFQPLMPILFLSFLTLPLLTLQLLPKPRRAQRPLLLYAVVYATLIALTSQSSWARFKAGNQPLQANDNLRSRVLSDFDIGTAERENGFRLHTFFHGNLPTVGVAAAGGFAYGYQGPVFDMLGLNDVRMAHADAIKTGPIGHRSFDPNVFYQIAPDLLNPWSSASGPPPDLAPHYAYYLDTTGWDNMIYKDLFHQPRFLAAYAFGVITDDSQPGISCMGFFKRSYLQQLSANPHIHITLAPVPTTAAAK